MKIIKSKNELTCLLNEERKKSKTIGFVPTMGALHEGHFSLVEAAERGCDLTIVSIFINPTQFDNSSDLKNYPRKTAEDIKKLHSLFKNLIIFTPDTQEIYEEAVTAENFDFGKLEHKMEGAFRQGHFDGVGTVLKKLFKIVQPDKAYFGEKDYQQLLIVKKLVEIIGLPIEIIGCPISREANGLARSSRNERLSAQQKEEAALLYQSLIRTKTAFGIKNAAALTEEVKSEFKKHPACKLDYFEIADARTLEAAHHFETGKKYRAFIAAFIGEIRLIDNIALN